MRLRLFLIGAAASIGIVAGGCGGSSSPSRTATAFSIVQAATSPWPEGPVGPVAAMTRKPGLFVPLQEIRDAIPTSLPENPKQQCRVGATVTVTLKDGRVFTYGPCRRPASIERLRRALVRAAERTHPAPAERPVAGREWKALINDWYDGRIDRWYRCAVVREAIAHLPASPPTVRSIRNDFASYGVAVCQPRR